MKTLTILLAGLILTGCSSLRPKTADYKGGYDQGWNAHEDEKPDTPTELTFTNGFKRGYDQGYEEGQNLGYEDGKADAIAQYKKGLIK